MAPKEFRIDPRDRLDACPTKGAALTWPVPLDEHLDTLKSRAEASGERTTRRELAAAILYAAPKDGEKLAKMLKQYRMATVSELVGGQLGENVVTFTSRKPGPRPRQENRSS